jgi:hypothetical protein
VADPPLGLQLLGDHPLHRLKHPKHSPIAK